MAAGEIFAAIDVGSYEIGLKVYELSARGAMREIDHVVHRIDLGSETYATGRISAAHVKELTVILSEFREIMKSYGVKNYRAYATSALRETHDSDVVLNLVEAETSIKVSILSNSEQRFLDYKSVAMHGKEFARIIEDPTVFADIGGGSIQLSVFDKDKLSVTQNIRMGVLRTQQMLMKIDTPPSKFATLIREMTAANILDFKKMYLEGKKIKNLIIVDDYLSPYLCSHSIAGMEKGYTTAREYKKFLSEMSSLPRSEMAARLNISIERIPLVSISARIIESIADRLEAETLWTPGVTLADGITYDYAEKKKLITVGHDFERDILAAAYTMARRYECAQESTEIMVKTSLEICDAIKKQQDLKKRERLLLRIAAILFDCGRFISLGNLAESAYHIIMSTEMIGLSHKERKIVAAAVWLAHYRREGMAEAPQQLSTLEKDDRLLVAKLGAILRVADSVCGQDLMEYGELKVKLKNRELHLIMDAAADCSLEKGLLAERKDLFISVYGIEPVIRQKDK